MGGHGIDPVIRGQSQNRLNILLDDSFVYGGCPNRMDPPTAYAPLHSYDEIEIRKGITSLQDGPGGSGGTVLFRRVTPVFLENDAPVRGDFGGRYGSNGDSREAWTNLIVGNEDGYLRTFGQYGKANNYEDGDGREIASGYEIRQGGGSSGGRRMLTVNGRCNTRKPGRGTCSLPEPAWTAHAVTVPRWP